MKNIILVLSLFFAGLINAQNIKIEGLVTFEGEPAPETFITVKADKVYNATTNEEGYFSVEIPENVPNTPSCGNTRSFRLKQNH